MPISVPFAAGHPTPVWPLPDVAKRVATYGGLAFGAQRKIGARHHAGVDILASRRDIVVAPESGEIVASQTFNGPDAHALLVQTDTGPVLLLGEVSPGSWSEFGVAVGSRVTAGQPVARVGVNPGGSTMLHFETYTEGTDRNAQWWKGSAPPSGLLNPTRYLEQAAAGDPIAPVPTEEHEHADDERPHDEGSDMPDEQDFDPSDDDSGYPWRDTIVTPEQGHAFWLADYQPAGKYRAQQIVCTQDGGTYFPGNKCRTKDGLWCDAIAYMTGNCVEVTPWNEPEPDPMPEVEPEPDIADDIDPPLLPDIIPPAMTSPNGVPWWLLGAAALGLYFLTQDERG